MPSSIRSVNFGTGMGSISIRDSCHGDVINIYLYIFCPVIIIIYNIITRLRVISRIISAERGDSTAQTRHKSISRDQRHVLYCNVHVCIYLRENGNESITGEITTHQRIMTVSVEFLGELDVFGSITGELRCLYS